MRIELFETKRLREMRTRLRAVYRRNPAIGVIRRHPGRIAGLAGAAVVCGGLLVVVLQAHTPQPEEIATLPVEAQSAGAEAVQPEDVSRNSGVAAAATTRPVPTIEAATRLELVDIAAQAASLEPSQDRWAGASLGASREAQRQLAEHFGAGNEADMPAPNAFAALLEPSPDPTATAAISAAEMSATGEVAIAESEAEIAALEETLARQDAAIFATETDASASLGVSGEAERAGTVDRHVNMRASADNDAEILAVVPENGAILILDECPNWCAVEYDGRRGFIYGSFVRQGEAAAGTEGLVAEQ